MKIMIELSGGNLMVIPANIKVIDADGNVITINALNVITGAEYAESKYCAGYKLVRTLEPISVKIVDDNAILSQEEFKALEEASKIIREV